MGGIIRAARGIQQISESADASERGGKARAYIDEHPDVYTDPERLRQLSAIDPATGFAAMDRAAHMRELVNERAVERAQFMRDADLGAAQRVSDAISGGKSWREAHEDGNDAWQRARLQAENKFGGRFADAMAPVWDIDGFQERYPVYNRALDAMRGQYTITLPEQAPQSMMLLPTELRELTERNPGAVVKKIGTAGEGAQADPHMQVIQTSLDRRLADAKTLPERITALQEAQSQTVAAGTPGGRSQAGIYGQEIASLRSQMMDERKDEFARTGRELGLDPNEAANIGRITETMMAREREQAAGKASATTTATLQARLGERVPMEVARELGLKAGATWADASDMALAPVAPPSTATERMRMAEAESVMGVIDDMQQSYDPAMVGPLAGRALWAKVTTGAGGLTRTEARFWAKSKSLQNTMIRLITGAQMSEPEAQRIMGEVPSPNDPPVVWEEKLASTRENAARLREIIAGPGGGPGNGSGSRGGRGSAGAAGPPAVPDADVPAGTFKAPGGKTFKIVPR